MRLQPGAAMKKALAGSSMRWVVLPALMLAAVPAAAQQVQQVEIKRVEVTPIVSYATAAEIDMASAGDEERTLDDGVTWGAAVTVLMSTHWAIEGLGTFQSGTVSMDDGRVRTDLLDMGVHQYHGSVVYHFGSRDARVRPFLLGGTGVTVLTSPDFNADAKVSWLAGGGVKWYASTHVGIRGDLRYTPTMLHDTAESFCGPMTFCQGTLNHLRVGFGVVLSY